MKQLTEHFHESEFVCPCCGQVNMDRDTVEKLETLRGLYGKPIKIVEGGGYRCSHYEPSKTSAHREGRAVDPGVPREDLFSVVALAIACGFTGIGLKNRNGEWQLHLDDASEIEGVRPRPWIWTYDTHG